MSYRPEGWDFAHQKVSDKIPFFNPKSLCDRTTYEAGADAMLEGLRKKAGIEPDRPDIPPQHYKKGETEEIWLQAPCNGYLVFIPDD